jgi:hypothetical protein
VPRTERSTLSVNLPCALKGHTGTFVLSQPQARGKARNPHSHSQLILSTHLGIMYPHFTDGKSDPERPRTWSPCWRRGWYRNKAGLAALTHSSGSPQPRLPFWIIIPLDLPAPRLGFVPPAECNRGYCCSQPISSL